MLEPKLLTLTWVPRESLTPESVKTLRRYFQRLLHRKEFKQAIRGGLYVIEVKHGERDWNVHIHALIEASFIDQATISTAWRQITRDSYIVDIRRALSAPGGLKYVLKYLLKAPVLNGLESVYDQSLKGTRLVQTFGRFYRAKLQKPPSFACPMCGETTWISEFGLRQIAWGNSLLYDRFSESRFSKPNYERGGWNEQPGRTASGTA